MTIYNSKDAAERLGISEAELRRTKEVGNRIFYAETVLARYEKRKADQKSKQATKKAKNENLKF